VRGHEQRGDAEHAGVDGEDRAGDPPGLVAGEEHGRPGDVHQTADWGRFEQIGPLLRCGPGPAVGSPEPGGRPRLMLPRVGEHTAEVLAELGLPGAEIDALLAAKVARQLED
jgi:crotonobetainyl-CoA:carnitine CoA-transferase CaiB-like acyl-CoA transferase